MSESTDKSKDQKKIITLNKLEDASRYRLWRITSESTLDVYNVLNIVLDKEIKPHQTSDQFADWEYRHKLANEALLSSLKSAQLIRVAHLSSAHEIWKRLADEYGKISDLKYAQLDAKLRSIRKSSQTKMTEHIDEFERIRREMEYHSAPMNDKDVNIIFLLSLGDSDTWKNFRNSNLHRAVSMTTADLISEVTLIDETNFNPLSSFQHDEA